MELKNCEQSNIEMTAPQVQDNDWNYLIVSGDAFRVEINKHNGYLTKYEVNGRDMIKDGEALNQTSGVRLLTTTTVPICNANISLGRIRKSN